MPRYQCKVKNPEGETKDFLREGDSSLAITRNLKEEGYEILSLEEISEKIPKEEAETSASVLEPKNSSISSFTAGNLSYEELALFNRQLSEMVRNKIPLPEALKQLSYEIRSKKFKLVLEKTQQKLADGSSLQEAFNEYKEEFPSLYLRLLEAGEEAGTLSESLDNFAHYAESKIFLKQKVKEATAYPFLTFCFIFPLLLLLFYVVTPLLIDLHHSTMQFYKDIDISPSRKVQFLNGAYIALEALTNHATFITSTGFLFFALLLLFYFLSQKNSFFREKWTRCLLKIPFYGPVYYFSLLSLTLRSLAASIKSGVSLPLSLQLTSASLEDPVAKRAMDNLAKRTQDGEKLSIALKDETFFPPYISWLLTKDEGGAHFSRTLAHIADHYQLRTERRIENLKLLILPSAELFLGVIVFLAYLLFMLPLTIAPMDGLFF